MTEKFNQLVQSFKKKGEDHKSAIELAADSIEILKRTEAQDKFDTTVEDIQEAITNVDPAALNGMGAI